MNIYATLGIDHSADERAIKRAYASKVKQFRPETHPAEFAAIREAYEEALYLLRHNAQWDEPQEAEDVTPESEGSSASEITEMQSAAQPELAATPAEAVASAQPARNINDDMMDVLAAQPTEETALQEYRRQEHELQQMPLDLQMDYEQALSYWLLFSANPSLLVFAEADKRYGWSAHSLEIVRLYGNDAGSRFSVLLRLSELLSQARERHNPLLLVDGKRQEKMPWVLGHHQLLDARNLAQAWQQECKQAGYLELSDRIRLAPERKVQIYILDLEIGVFFAWVDWMIEVVKPDSWIWPNVVLTFALFAALPALVRMPKGWLVKKLSSQLEWYAQPSHKHKFGLMVGFLLLILMLLVLLLPQPASMYLLSAFAMLSLPLLLIKGYVVFAGMDAASWSKLLSLGNYLMRFFRPQYRIDEHGLQRPLHWNTELLAWLKNGREKWRSVKLSTYWWIVIWIIVLQLMSNLLKK